jgi:hypothetical protein
VLSALFDRLEEPEYPERQSEIVVIFRKLIPNFLSRGAVPAAVSPVVPAVVPTVVPTVVSAAA